ncbi:hypothetical protein [Gracilimonas tropica]|uniref:hypothetical protein n=1 Tax=Gracilimonas tropica TaxID=454600 RepID=UPI00035D2954|nr:hypothetical protein [Gracilimonas tropica]
MKKFFETTLGKIVLFAVVITVWGWNFFSFSEMSGEEETGQSQIYANITDEEYSIPEFDGYNYSRGNRNPFSIPAGFKTKQEQPASEPNEEEYRQPNITLNGVMEGMAILRDQRGQTFFVEEKDTFNTILVEKIYRDSVRLVHEGNAFTVNLN